MRTEHNREGLSASGSRFAVVVSRWNHRLTSSLEAGAVDTLRSAGASADAISVFAVPGAFELPLACKKAAESGRFDAVLALGVVIRGDTPHFDYVAGQAAAGVLQASLSTGVPILFGVITANTLEQAEARSANNEENKGREAAFAAIEMVRLMSEFKERGAAGRSGQS